MEVHAIISQYIIKHMESNEVSALYSVICKYLSSITEGLTLTFQQSYGVHDPSSLTAIDFLRYKLSEIENDLLPSYLKGISIFTVVEPHFIIVKIQTIKDALMTSPHTINLLSLFGEKFSSLIVDCKQILKNTHNICRILNQNIQKILYEKNYDELIQTLESVKNYPFCIVAQKAVTMVKNIIPHCDGEQIPFTIIICENFQRKTPDYNSIYTLIIPAIKLYIDLHKQITASLLKGSPYVERTYHYIINKFDEELELVKDNHFFKVQEVAPKIVLHTLNS